MQEALFQPTENFEYSFLREVPAHTMTRQHYHDGYEIYLHLSGARAICFNSCQYAMQRGTLYVVEPFVLHGTVSEPCLYSRDLVNFRRPMLEGFLDDAEITRLFASIKSCIMQLDETQLEAVQAHLRAIEGYWARKNRHEHWCAKLAYMEVYRLTDTICRLRAESSSALTLSAPVVVDEQGIYRVLTYIEQHYAEEIPIAQMLDCACMSQPTFYRAFKRVTGDSFASYLSRYRLLKAHILIAETALSLSDIALKTGFSSAVTLSRAFREEFGMAPARFRKPAHASR